MRSGYLAARAAGIRLSSDRSQPLPPHERVRDGPCGARGFERQAFDLGCKSALQIRLERKVG